jgi:hypothetical protein
MRSFNSFGRICQYFYLLSLFAPSVPAPAPAIDHRLMQISSLYSSFSDGTHKQCAVQQRSGGSQPSARKLFSPRDCTLNPDIINYWSYYPYTTAIRPLNTDEHTFFGQLGYHTRDHAQRATDKTYLWYIPKRTKTVNTTETIHRAALTETVYLVMTATTTETTISTSKEITTETATVYRGLRPTPPRARTKTYPIGSINNGIIEGQAGMPRHSTTTGAQDTREGTSGYGSSRWTSVPARDNLWTRRDPVLGPCALSSGAV